VIELLWLLWCLAPRSCDEPYLLVLGTAQDAGAPQAGCEKACCSNRWGDPGARRLVASLGLVDPRTARRWLFDATPDFPAQAAALSRAEPTADGPLLNGIFLTHAHIGHYTGLIHLGREVMGAEGVAVHAMPRMARFLETNGPWSQLVGLANITIKPVEHARPVALGEGLEVTPIRVPHRDEFSETVAYRIKGPNREALYLPDIDKWEKWDLDIEALLVEVDYALLDGTFFDGDELPGRDMAEIPHPFIVESMVRFADLPPENKKKVIFIHLNHTNPALERGSEATEQIEQAGFRIARRGMRLGL